MEVEKRGSEALSVNSPHISALTIHPECFGRMNDPTSAAAVKGPCGDEMEFYLVIRDEIIQEAKFYTEGCAFTIACGEMTARLATGKSIEEALGISPLQVQEMLRELPADFRHCSILAVSTLYRAIADYLLRNRI